AGDSLVERLAVRRGVIKPAAGEGEVAVVRESGVERDLMAQLEEFIELAIELVPLHEAPAGDAFPCLPAEGAVGLLKVGPHLGKGPFLASEGDGEGTAQLLVLLADAR